MPRYRYKCTECLAEITIVHAFDDVVDYCTGCESHTMKKMLTTPLANVKFGASSLPTNQNIGDVTKQYIEDNKEILEAEKNRLKKEFYGSS